MVDSWDESDRDISRKSYLGLRRTIQCQNFAACWRHLGALRAIPFLFALIALSPVGAAERDSLSLRVEDLTWPEIDSAIKSGKTTAIIMAGSTEEGGPHMALGKHNVIVRYVGEHVARKLGNALVYPGNAICTDR